MPVERVEQMCVAITLTTYKEWVIYQRNQQEPMFLARAGIMGVGPWADSGSLFRRLLSAPG